MDHDLVAELPARDAVADLPDDAGGVGAADVVPVLRVVAVRMTETGSPSAAHTLLKLTPAAITRTTTSKAPGSRRLDLLQLEGVTGSPRRSSRITHAVIVSGSVPGSVATVATWLTSTATRHLFRVEKEVGRPAS